MDLREEHPQYHTLLWNMLVTIQKHGCPANIELVQGPDPTAYDFLYITQSVCGDFVNVEPAGEEVLQDCFEEVMKPGGLEEEIKALLRVFCQLCIPQLLTFFVLRVPSTSCFSSKSKLRCPQTLTPSYLPPSRTSSLSLVSIPYVTFACFVYLSHRLSVTDRQSIILFCVCHNYCVRAPAFLNDKGRRKVTGSLLHLCLEEFNYIRSSHPLERIPLPAPLYHIPHLIRGFRMNRPR